MKSVTLGIEGMHCEGCASRVRSALESVEGVESAEVSLDGDRAEVVVDDGTEHEALVRAVEEAGYSATT